MKNLFKVFGIAAFITVIGFAMTACGGGGGYKKSGLSTDGFFGALPGLYADYNIADDVIREKYKAAKEKAEQKRDIKAYQKAEEQFEKSLDEISTKLETDVSAEWAKLAGKDVPFTTSSNFREFKVNSLKISEDGHLALSASDVRKNMMGVTSFKFKAIAKDGSVIIDYVGYGSDKIHISQAIWSNPEEFVNFEKIEFSNYE